MSSIKIEESAIISVKGTYDSLPMIKNERELIRYFFQHSFDVKEFIVECENLLM